MTVSPISRLADRWRDEAEILRRNGHDRSAAMCERHADRMEEAAAARSDEALSLEEAADFGGYSYSHLQTLVSDGTIENVGEKGSPRIRRGDVPRKPGHRAQSDGRLGSKAEVLEDDVVELRRRQGEDR